MNKSFALFNLYIWLCLAQTGCSVASLDHNTSGPGLSSEIAEPISSVETPSPTEPVIVSEPINVIPPTNSDNQQADEPTVMEPVVESEVTPDFYIEETPTNPAMIVVEGTPITNVEFEPVTAEASVAPEKNEIPVVAETEDEPVLTPQEIIDAVESIDIQTPTEIAEEADQDLEQVPESPEVSEDGEKDMDFVVEGKCHGKKKATVLYNRKGKKKKGLTALCKKDRFKIKIREKKKHLKTLKVQTLLQ